MYCTPIVRREPLTSGLPLGTIAFLLIILDLSEGHNVFTTILRATKTSIFLYGQFSLSSQPQEGSRFNSTFLSMSEIASPPKSVHLLTFTFPILLAES